MARKSKRTSRRRQVKQSKKRAHTRKHYRKQQSRLRQRGGVSDDLPTAHTLNGTPYVANDDIQETSVSVQGFGQMTPKEYKNQAEKGELVVDN